MSLDLWSATPASNDMANYFQTGMAPSKVKNAGWDVMADATQVIGPSSMPTSGGTANAQTITNTRPYGALFTGMWAVFVPGNTNTGSMTLQVDGLTAKNVFANGAAALAGQVVSGIPAVCRYDGTQWQLINPQRSTGSATITIATGLTTTPTATLNYAIDSSGLGVDAWVVTGVTGTSNLNSMTVSGWPTAIQRTSAVFPIVSGMTDNGINTWGDITGLTTGTVTFRKNGVAANFTTTGTKGITSGFSVHYTKD